MIGDRHWYLGGPAAGSLPPMVKALAEHCLRQGGGDPLVALVAACELIGAMSPAVARGMVRGSADRAAVAEVMAIVAKSGSARQ